MKVQLETVCPAETLYIWTVMNPAKRLLGIPPNVNHPPTPFFQNEKKLSAHGTFFSVFQSVVSSLILNF